jgi:hypothetical protein
MTTQIAVNDVRRNLSLGKTEAAIAVFEALLEGSPKKDDLVVQTGRWNRLEKQYREGLITLEQRDVGTTNLYKALIHLAREVEGESDTYLAADFKTYKVNIYFFACDFDVTSLKNKIIRQNKRQNIFEFQLVNWPLWSGRVALEEDIRAQQFRKRLSFVDSVIEKVRQFPQQHQGANTIDLVITSLRMPRRFYAWNNKERDGIVISVGKLRSIFGTDEETINAMVVRVMQRMLIYGLHLPGLQAHEATRGCVFDLTVDIRELKHSIEINYLCKACETIIASSPEGIGVLKQINDWVDNLILEA